MLRLHVEGEMKISANMKIHKDMYKQGRCEFPNAIYSCVEHETFRKRFEYGVFFEGYLGIFNT